MANRSRYSGKCVSCPENQTSSAAWWQHRSAELSTDLEADCAYAQSLEGQIEALERRLELLRSDAPELHTTELSELTDRLGELCARRAAAEEAEFAAEWTRDVTVERRVSWNALVKSGVCATPLQARRQEAVQGWSLRDLKRAVQRWDL